MSKIIDIMSLYPKDMNIYGDSGNVLTVSRRLSPVCMVMSRLFTNTIRVMTGRSMSISFWAVVVRTPVKRRLLMTSTCVPTCCARWPQTVPLCL